MAIADRILPLCELLMGAAYADEELRDEEKDEVRALIKDLAGEVPDGVEETIKSFDPKSFDVKKAAEPFALDSEVDRKKLLVLVSAINVADEEIDLREDEYLRALATALDLPNSALEGLVIDVETEELKETFERARRPQTIPPPMPPGKKKTKLPGLD
jgi:uncharacterized tellurite resistance protein B-like protein